MFVLTIQLPHGQRRLEVPATRPGRLLTDVLRDADLPLNTRCGHRGLCEGCLVELLTGQLEDVATHASASSDGRLLRGCLLRLPAEGAATIHIPARSLLAHQPQVVSSFRLNVPRAHDPLWQVVRVPRRSVPDDAALPDSLRRAVAEELDCGLPLQWGENCTVPDLREDGCFHLVVEHRGEHRILKGCDVDGPAYGVAVDVGTTTVVVALVELATGRLVADASALNAQTRLGDNVLTRINLCMTKPELIERLQRAIVRGTLAPLLADVVRQAAIDPSQLTCMAVAGNTTMLHLLLGVDPSSLGKVPFKPVFLGHRVVAAAQLGLRWKPARQTPAGGEGADRSPGDDPPSLRAIPRPIIPRMAVHLLPGAAAYVGADITAGVLASGMAYRDETCLLIDLGTNGEIVLRHQQHLVACATAAGPAFEGAGLTFGMRAGSGAIGHVFLEGENDAPRIEVIGERAPIGLCGTAYIDFVARARRAGLITATARFTADEHRYLIRHKRHGRAFVVARQDDGEPLLITEADMACLLQAKAAIAAGIICLLRETDLQPSDVHTVYLAGGFGFHMHLDSLLGCGMLPGFREEQVQTVGNTALAGAYLTLLDSQALLEIRRVSDQMRVIELNLAPDFEMIYIDQLSLP